MAYLWDTATGRGLGLAALACAWAACGGGGSHATAKAVCGDGEIEAPETCDDGDTTDDGNGCSATCQRNSVCGDGVVQSLFEQCDDGNLTSGDGCDADCRLSCGNGARDPVEACDGTPGCTSTCAYDGAALVDFDVAGDGSAFLLAAPAGSLTGRCFGDDGTLARDTFTVSTFAAGETFVDARVAVARTAKIALVAWETTTSSGTALSGRLFDGACQPITSAFSLAPSSDGFAIAVAQDGSSIVTWEDPADALQEVRFLSPTGSAEGTTSTIAPCASGAVAGAAISPASAAAVVTCTGAGGVGWILFDPSAFTQTTPSWVQAATTGPSAVGMNDGGAFAIERIDPGDLDVHVDLYATDGSNLGTHALGPGLGDLADRIQTASGDFLIAGDGRVWREGAGGQLDGCDLVAAAPTVLRTGGTEVTFALDGGAVTRGLLDYSRWAGCAPPTCGDGTVETGETCDDGNLVSDDGCDQFCKKEICGDGIVQTTETCDGGDGCSSTCQLENPAPAASPISVSAVDYDVAGDGAIAAVELTDDAIDVACWGATHAPSRARFPVPTGIAVPIAAGVWTSRAAKTSLVVWQDAGQVALQAELLDDACLVARAPFAIPIVPGAGFDAARDDLGRAVVVSASASVGVAFVDENGFQIGVVQTLGLPSGDAPAGVHAAMDGTNGDGAIVVEDTAGDVYERRFSSMQEWLDPDFVPVALTPQPGMSCTIGMNDADQSVVLCRATDGTMQAVFVDASGAQGAPVTVSARTRAGETIAAGAFSTLHDPVPLSGANFVLGESYGGGTADTSIVYRVYAPDGTFLTSYEAAHTTPYGVAARRDLSGVSFFFDGMAIYYGAGEL